MSLQLICASLFIAGIFVYIFLRFSLGITRSSTCLFGKTAIVTGANSGIGYQVALNLASRGCKVIIASNTDAEEARKNVISYTNNNNIVSKKLDLSSLESVCNFASDILKSEERLDILFNNAGILASRYQKTEDGLDTVMQVNYFGHFLLTHLLIDLLKKSAPSRIIWTSSCMSFFHKLNRQTLNGDGSLLSITKYSNSKLAVLIASDIFAEKLKNTGVTSNSVHPGIVSTNVIKNFYSVDKPNLLVKFIIDLGMYIYSKDPWEGSQTLIHVAVSNKLEKVTGQHFWDCRPFFKPRIACNQKFCDELWRASLNYVNLSEHSEMK